MNECCGRRILREKMRNSNVFRGFVSVCMILTVYLVVKEPLDIPYRIFSYHSIPLRPDSSYSDTQIFNKVSSFRVSVNVPSEAVSTGFVEHVRKLLQNGSERAQNVTEKGIDVTMTSQDLKSPKQLKNTAPEGSITHVYTGRDSFATDPDFTEEYRARIEDLKQACTQMNSPQNEQFDLRRLQGSNIVVDRQRSILYCPIPKVGSTFWKRTLTVMGSGKKYFTPFQLKLGEFQPTKLDTMIEYSTDDELSSFMENATSFIVVRDPYSRLFSAYLDKLYNPNYIFWKTYGTRIIKATRRQAASADERTYGHNATFTEFLRFILKLSELHYNIDPHFNHMYKRCDPCRMPFHFIGKLETFKQDALFLLNHWRKQFNDFNVSFSDFEMETALDTAVGHVNFLYDTWNKVRAIDYPFYNLALRVWSSLQIRGLVSKDIPFPFNEEEMPNVSKPVLIEAIRVALGRSTDREALAAQREEALVQAYRMVPMVYLKQLRKYVAKDCLLFGYDSKPDKIFNRSFKVVNDHFYMKGI